MKRSFTPAQIQQIRRRHQGYQMLLLVISVILLTQPLAQIWPWLTGLESIALALVMILFLVRYSPLHSRKHIIYSLAWLAIGIELIWMGTLAWMPSMARHMAIPHLLIWTLFIGTFLLRKIRALMLEPFVTPAVVMGAAAGYLLIGYLGGFLLHSLLLLHPGGFNLSMAAEAGTLIARFPDMVVGSFGALTTVGNSLGREGQLLVPTACLLITVAGQLYVAVLIALILGRFHQRG
ncbi:MAG: hypothetical protein VKK62_00060 [Synechococcaceae cyanobacterium]|nr:hypothetical protein [Synechococcaceae cyanobacterium]